MNKKILIIKTGSAYEQIKKIFGDFDELIISKSGFDHNKFISANINEGFNLPDHSRIYSVIITGSHYMASENFNWENYLKIWLKKAITIQIPILGICFGHQIIAKLFGGTVCDNQKGLEIGTCELNLTSEGEIDYLFEVLPTNFYSQSFHQQSVIKVPKEAIILVENKFDSCQAYRLGRSVWGVQFHPEFNADILKKYLEIDQDKFIKLGYDLVKISQNIKDSYYGEVILNRFLTFHTN